MKRCKADAVKSESIWQFQVKERWPRKVGQFRELPVKSQIWVTRQKTLVGSGTVCFPGYEVCGVGEGDGFSWWPGLLPLA